MIRPKTPKKIKRSRKKTKGAREGKGETKSEDTGILEPLCEYAVPGKEISENYPFPYKCGVMYECRYKHPTQKITKNCPRRQIGDNIKKEKHHGQRSGAYKRD